MRRNSMIAPLNHQAFDFFEVQLFGNLLHPFLNALVGQLRLAVFINGEADEVVVIRRLWKPQNDTPPLASDRRWSRRAAQ